MLLLACLWLLPAVSLGQNLKKVAEIKVEGVKKTKPVTVLRQLTFAEGDEIDMDGIDALVEKNHNNIYNLYIFTRVDITWDSTETDVSFVISVQERWYVWPSPHVALEERTFNEWWEDKDLDRLVVGMGVDWGNFTGYNDRLYLYGQIGYSRRATLQYRRPFLFPKPQIDGTITFQYVNNKEIGYGTVDGVLQLARLQEQSMREYYIGSIGFAKRFSPRDQLQWSLGYQYFRPNDSIVFFNDRYLTDGAQAEHYPSLRMAYVRDERDIRSFPLKGFKYSASARLNGLPGIGTSRFGKFTATFSHHIALTDRWNFAYGSQNFLLAGNKVPYYDKFFVGFGSFLRGYERYVVDASFANLTKAEWKFGIFPRKIYHAKWIPLKRFQDFPFGLYISAYADVGYVTDWTFNNLDNYLKNRLLTGYGMGINVVTIYDFMLRAEYSFNHFGQSGIYLSGLVSIQ